MPCDSLGHQFPLEEPTRADFYLWESCVRAIVKPSLQLHQPLGKYLQTSHLKRRWTWAQDSDELYFVHSDGPVECYDLFCREPGIYPTRYGSKYRWIETKEGVPPSGIYASVRELSDNTVTLHSSCPIYTPIPVATDFWEVLHSFENQSLWRYFHCDGDGKWIHNGLLLGTLVIVHDGSYMKEVAQDVCSAGFMIYCTHTRCRAKGTVVEKSDSADNYRAEVLGGIMIQLVLKAASQLQSSPYAPVQIHCDNLGVVNHGNTPTRSLKEKQAQADALRILKHLIQTSPLEVIYGTCLCKSRL